VKPHVELKEKARKLYLEGKSYRKIKIELGVSKSSISLWCRDLVEEKLKSGDPEGSLRGFDSLKLRDRQISKPPFDDYYVTFQHQGTDREVARLRHIKTGDIRFIALPRYVMSVHLNRELDHEEKVFRKKGLSCEIENLYIKVKHGKAVTHTGKKVYIRRGILTDKDVIHLRAEAHRTGYMHLREYGKKYGVCHATISMAIRGVTFVYLNDEYPPVRFSDLKDVRPPTKAEQREALIQEMIQMRLSDPVKWNYDALRDWMKEKSGKNYRSTHIIQVLRHRSPEIIELDKLHPTKSKIKKPKVKKKYKVECAICEDVFETHNRHAELCGKPECLDVLRQANLREKQMKKLHSAELV